jgi:hypothetical protein
MSVLPLLAADGLPHKRCHALLLLIGLAGRSRVMLGASTPPVAAADQMLSLHVLHACSESDNGKHNDRGNAVSSQQADEGPQRMHVRCRLHGVAGNY